MELIKTDNFGSIRTPIGIIRIVEKDGQISLLEWSKKVEKAYSPLIISTLLKIKKYFDKKTNINSVPKRINLTPLQIKILETVSHIPFGKTISYGAIAKKLNTNPRIVGQACSKNPLPLIIPCHRVITSQNKIGGYSCGNGLETKLWLLKHENTKLI